MKKIYLTIIFLFTAFALHAQTIERKELTFGASIGGGVLHFTSGNIGEATSGNLSLPNLKVGWMFKQNLGVFLNAPGQIYSENGKDRGFEGLIPSVQYWPADKFWVGAGFGLAMDFPAFYEVKKVKDEDWNLGKGALLSAGYEIMYRSNWTMDIQTRALMSSFKLDDGTLKEGANFTIGVGFNFF